MTPPIILNENGDVTFFPTVEAAAQYMEPIDVRNEEYVAYDSSGFVLQLVADARRVLITGRASASPSTTDLMSVLQSLWQRAAHQSAPGGSLQELVQRSVERFGYAQ